MCSKLLHTFNYRYIQLILLNWTTMLQQIQIHSNFSFSIHRLFLYLSSPFPSISFAGMTVYLFLTSMRWVYANSSTIDCAVLYYTQNRKDLYCSHTLHMWTRYLFIFKNRFQPYQKISYFISVYLTKTCDWGDGKVGYLHLTFVMFADINISLIPGWDNFKWQCHHYLHFIILSSLWWWSH